MSTRDIQPTFAKTTGGTIHTETDNPDLLSLFQTDSALGAETQNSFIVETAQVHNDPFAESQESVQNNPVSVFERQTRSSVLSSPTPGRSLLSPAQHSDEELPSPVSEEKSEQLASGIDSPIRHESDPQNAVKNKTSNTSVPAAQSSKHLPYSVNPKSPYLSPSGLARVLHQAEQFDDRKDGDDNWGEEEDEEQGEKEIILISHPVSLAGTEGSDIYEAEDTDSDAEGEKSAIVRTAPSLVESRNSLHSSANKNTLFSNPSAYSRPGLPSPDLQNPQHQRFIIPYASRRLKGQTPRNSRLSSAKAADGQTDLKQTYPVLRGDSWGTGVRAKPVNINNSSISQSEDEQLLSAPLKGEEEEDFGGFDPTNNSNELQDSLEVSHSDADLSDNQFVLDRTLPVPSPPVESRKGIGDVALTIQTSAAPRYSPAEHRRTLNSPSGSAKEPSGMPAVKEPERVYVESPTFTREEEEQYRFVSSRVEDYVEHDHHPTFRGLDESAVKSMEGASGRVQPGKKPVKQVRYVDDEDRYEDRNENLQPKGGMVQGKSERQDIPSQKQYVMKSKTESASGQRLSATRPVQGLVLPSGPSFDPEDEEDLKNEISYQEQLKSRISEAQRVAEETTVPRLPLWDGDSEDFVQDSLDVPEDIELDSERHKHHRDSVDIYHNQQWQPPQNNIHNMEWGNPPAPPLAMVPHPDFSAPPSQPQSFPQALSHDGLAFNYDTREGYVGAKFSNAYKQPQASNRDPEMPQQRPQYYPEEEVAHQHAHFSHGYAPLKQQQQSSQFRQLPHPQSQQVSYYAPQHQQLEGRHHQQHPQQQNAYYLQEQEQYLSDMDPAFQGQHPQVVRTGHYMDRGGPPPLGYMAPQAEVHDGYYMTETQSYGSGRGNGHGDQPNLEGGGVYGNPAKFFDQNSYEAEDEGPQLYAEHEGSIPLEMSIPPKPSYNYITNNKIDYGRAPRRTYKKIHEVKKDEKEKLADIFVTPKSKKKSSDSQLSSRDNSLKRYPAIAEHPGQEMGMASDAEHLWAHRSATLAQTRMPGRKKQHSNTSLQSIKSQQMNLSNTSLPSSRSQMDPVHLPLRRPLELKPVHQEVITEDGQRISVDVNLRLISPTAQGEHEHLGQENVPSSRYSGPTGEPRQRWPGQQYPADNALSSGQPYAFQDENEYRQGRYSADDAFASKKHGGLASGYLSDSHHDYNGTHTVNPFPKIPPIPIGSDDGAPRSAPVLSEGSYMQTYLREKEKMEKGEKPWYRVYSLQDYKRMQKEVCLGTLGPDLDSETFKEKREKMLRQNEYARSVKEKNAKEKVNRKPPAVPKPKEQDDIINKRTLAIEYAKNVPKPTVKPKPTPYNSYTLASQLSPIAKNSGRSQQKNSFPEPSVEMLDLERLHHRHEEDKRNAEQIRQKAHGIW